jgi:hypothetical protein
MHSSIAVAAILGAAPSAALSPLPSLNDGQLVLGSLSSPSRFASDDLYALQDAFGNSVRSGADFPIRVIGLDDIRSVRNPRDETSMMCCPPGTVFNGQRCVFLASQICPKGFALDPETKSICISTTPPCPAGLVLYNGLCISAEGPRCPGMGATFNPTTSECESIKDPGCDAPLEMKEGSCISHDSPRCPPGTQPIGAQCISTSGPTCGSSDLVVDKDREGKLVCASIDPPYCPSGGKPVGDQCVSGMPPNCTKGFEFEGGSCIYKGSRCPAGSVYTEFTDERSPVCRAVEKPPCPAGSTLQDKECVSDELPCPKAHSFDESTRKCVRFEKITCPDGMRSFLTSSEHSAPVQAYCCPDVPRMELTLDEDEPTCVVPSRTADCPDGMSSDPDKERCTYIPNQRDCARGTLDPKTGLCRDITDPNCSVGKPFSGGCTLGPPPCKTPGAKYDPKTGFCHLIELPPPCPNGTIQVGHQCISTDPNSLTCPPGTKPSNCKTKCVYEAPPRCSDAKATYDKDRQLCVYPNKPECDPKLGLLIGSDCVSPSLPVCGSVNGIDMRIDPSTGQCVSTAPPKCDLPGFHIPAGGNKCISIAGPRCDGPGLELIDGKCVSDKDPKCPPGSSWVQVKKACVSDQGPCAEGTPDADGNCVVTAPPVCKVAGTHFVPGVGCQADKIPTCTAPGTHMNEETRQCEADEPPRCEDGLERRGMLCVSPRGPTCPAQTEPTEDGRCIARTPIQCPGKGLKYNKDKHVCVGQNPSCPDGSMLDKGFEKCITASARTCFALLSCPDVEDDLVQLPGGIEQPLIEEEENDERDDDGDDNGDDGWDVDLDSHYGF